MWVPTCPPAGNSIATMSLTRGYVAASIQRAMLGEVTADLRAVAGAVDPGRVRARFVYEPPATELAERTVSDIEAEIIGDLPPDQLAECRFEVLPVGAGVTLGEGEFWVFLRREQR